MFRNGVRIQMLLSLVIVFSTAAAQEHIYGLDSSLSQVVNWESFANDLGRYSRTAGGVIPLAFSSAERDQLLKNGFVATSAHRNYAAEQFFHVYESDHYGSVPKIPNFVTADCALQAYHLYFSYLLRTIEANGLYFSAGSLTNQMLRASFDQYSRIDDPHLKSAAQKNIAYFLVARQLLSDSREDLLAMTGTRRSRKMLVDNAPQGTFDFMGMDIPLEAVQLARAEFEKIKSHSARQPSELFAVDLDYTQFIPRGHYTRDSRLESYFLAMMWFGLGAFPSKVTDEHGMTVRCDECLRQALLMTDALYQQNEIGRAAIDEWNKLYRTTAAFAGQADFLTPVDIHELIADVYPDSHALAEFADPAKFSEFAAKFEQAEAPRIRHAAQGMAAGVQFRLMGQRYILDSEILQTLSAFGVRPFPRGLDVFAVLGSERAALLLDSVYQEPANWEHYLPLRDSLKQQFRDWTPEGEQASVYHAWLDVLRELITKPDPAAPLFAQNSAWLDKELTTALASWAEGRHDIILYANASYAEGDAGFEKPPLPKGYVEPVPKVFAKLNALVKTTRDVLRENNHVYADADVLAVRLSDLVGFLESCAEKELAGTPLATPDYVRIQYIGSELEQLSTDIVNLDRNMPAYNWEGQKVEMEPHPLRGWFEVTGPDRDLAVIADVHTSGDQCLEVAVGHVDEIFVIVPIDGELCITRGGVFSYYEFPYPMGHRLTDEAWQEMLKRKLAPERPAWTVSYLAD